MVYIDPNELKWLPFVQSWLSKLSDLQEDLKDFVLELFKRAVDRIFNHIAKHCDQGISQVRSETLFLKEHFVLLFISYLMYVLSQVNMGKIQALCACMKP